MMLLTLSEELSLAEVRSVYGAANEDYYYALMKEMFAQGITESRV